MMPDLLAAWLWMAPVIWYGVTNANGAYANGSVFKLTPSNGGWTYITLHYFTYRGADGSLPVGGPTVDAKGKRLRHGIPGRYAILRLRGPMWCRVGNYAVAETSSAQSFCCRWPVHIHQDGALDLFAGARQRRARSLRSLDGRLEPAHNRGQISKVSQGSRDKLISAGRPEQNIPPARKEKFNDEPEAIARFSFFSPSACPRRWSSFSRLRCFPPQRMPKP